MKRCGMPFETMADYVEGRADEDAAAQIRAHLAAGCRTCQDNIAWLESAAKTLQETVSVRVPQLPLDRAYALFRERFRVPARPSLFALLQFDGRASNSLALSGARSADQEGFALIYSADDYDIDLFQEPAEAGTWYLIGQLLPKNNDSEIVPQEIVLTAADGKQTTVAPTSAEFSLPSLSAGAYEMRLQLADVEIVISSVEIGR